MRKLKFETLASIAFIGLAAAGAQAATPEPQPEQAVARLQEAEITHDRAQLQLSIDDFTRQVESEPSDAAAHYYLARSYFPLMDIYDADGDADRAEEAGEKGIEYAREAVRLDPEGNADAYRLVGDFYGRLTFYKGIFTRLRYGGKGQSLHAQALEMDPQNPLAVIGVGTDKLYAPETFGGDPQEAADLFMKASKMDPASPVPHVWLARAYQRLEKPEMARQALDQALELRSDSAIARTERAKQQATAASPAS